MSAYDSATYGNGFRTPRSAKKQLSLSGTEKRRSARAVDLPAPIKVVATSRNPFDDSDRYVEEILTQMGVSKGRKEVLKAVLCFMEVGLSTWASYSTLSTVYNRRWPLGATHQSGPYQRTAYTPKDPTSRIRCNSRKLNEVFAALQLNIAHTHHDPECVRAGPHATCQKKNGREALYRLAPDLASLLSGTQDPRLSTLRPVSCPSLLAQREPILKDQKLGNIAGELLQHIDRLLAESQRLQAEIDQFNS